MTSAVFDNFPVKYLTGLVNVKADSASTFCVLGTTAPVKATWATYNDVKWAASSPFEIAVVNGYALGGSGIATAVPTVNTAVVGIKSTAATVFTTNSTITASMSIVQNLINTGSPTSTTTTNPLAGYLDIGDQSVTNGTLTLTWNAAGIFTMTVGAAA